MEEPRKEADGELKMYPMLSALAKQVEIAMATMEKGLEGNTVADYLIKRVLAEVPIPDLMATEQ